MTKPVVDKKGFFKINDSDTNMFGFDFTIKKITLMYYTVLVLLMLQTHVCGFIYMEKE